MRTFLIVLLTFSSALAQTNQPCSSTQTACPPPWDSSGNSLLSTNYFFRYVQYTVGDQQGDLSHAFALYGEIGFDGNGNYTISPKTAMALDSNNMLPAPPPESITGTYSIGNNGFGYITNPASPGDVIWGMISANKVFVGSTTETLGNFNDLFVAAQVPTSAGLAGLQGSYSIAYMNFPDGAVGDNIVAGFQMFPDGRGHARTLNIEMEQASSGASADVTEPANYYFSNDAWVLNFPTYGPAISRSKYLYMSPDTGFVFGGGPDAFDMFVGVRTSPMTSQTPSTSSYGYGSSNFTGLFYQAGMDEILSGSGASLTGSLQTYYGAFNATSGVITGHQRILAPIPSSVQLPPNPSSLPASYPYQPFSYTFSDAYSLEFGELGYVDASTGRQYVIGDGGLIRLGLAANSTMGISIALQAPGSGMASSSSMPSVTSAGVQNAASNAPFTSGVSPGELVLISTSNVGTVSSVTINQTPADIVTCPQQQSQQVCVVLPASISPLTPEADQNAGAVGPYRPYPAEIQVSGENGAVSTWTLVNQTTPGVFTQSGNGLGAAGSAEVAAGGRISLLVTGLGTAGSAGGIGVPGAFGSSGTLSSLAVAIGGMPATINSVETSTGISTVNVTVPQGVSGTSASVSVAGVDATTNEATLVILP
jgi:hypothetical protein